jgi:hypothetical protein
MFPTWPLMLTYVVLVNPYRIVKRKGMLEHTIAPAAALFSGVVFNVDTAQVYTSGLAENEPGVYRNAAKYLAGLLRVATVITNPTIEIHRAGMMCNDRDLIRSEFHAQAQETRAAKM